MMEGLTTSSSSDPANDSTTSEVIDFTTKQREAEVMSTTTSPSPPLAQTNDGFLRAALLIDAAVTGANGLAYLVAATLLTTLLGPPVPFLIGIGGFLATCAAVFLLVGRARRIPHAGVWFAIVVNVAWAVASVIYTLTADWLTPIGQLWAVLQALVVFGFSVAQLIGLRRARS